MKWISVDDKLPKQFKDVLVLSDLGVMEVTFYYISTKDEVEWVSFKRITHWRKLPNRPIKHKKTDSINEDKKS